MPAHPPRPQRPPGCRARGSGPGRTRNGGAGAARPGHRSDRSRESAAAEAAAQGYTAHILSDAIEGEAREVARLHAALAREIATRDRPFRRPAVLLSGGETTVTLRGKGRGGRNTEFLLSLALAREIELCVSEVILAEYEGVLRRKKFSFSSRRITDLLTRILIFFDFI